MPTGQGESPIKFGTDGWRAAIAETYTFENVRMVAQATANYLQNEGTAGSGLVVGYDMRFASEHFAAAVAGVLAGNGIECWLTDRAAPTPAVAYAILTHGAAGAAMITASHNPWTDNGYKYKPEYAGSADPATIEAIESQARAVYAGAEPRRVALDEALAAGAVRMFDPAPEYLRRLGEIADIDRIRQADLKIVSDPMYGAGMGYLPRLLAGGTVQLIEINNERNPYFGGITPEPIARNLGKLMSTVKETGADVGLAVDGDADRCGLVDENGRFIDQLVVYGLLTMYLLEKKGWRGPIVKSVSTTSMANRLGQQYGVPVVETPVGFKYIGPELRARDGMIGGEESGGYAFRGHIPERDGTLASLYLLEMMLDYDMPVSQIVARLQEVAGPSHYKRIDVRFPPERRSEVLGRFERGAPDRLAGERVESVQTIDGFKYFLSDGSWLLVRSSGTEPLIRLYTEASSPEMADRVLQAGKEIAGLA